MRIDTDLSEDTSERVQNLADEKGWQKPKAYTKLIRAGVSVQERREQIKQYITDFFKEEKPRHEERLEGLKTEYGVYLAISTENLNPIHLIDREKHEPFCGEKIEDITTEDERLDRDEAVSRRGICSSCLDEYEERW